MLQHPTRSIRRGHPSHSTSVHRYYKEGLERETGDLENQLSAAREEIQTLREWNGTLQRLGEEHNESARGLNADAMTVMFLKQENEDLRMRLARAEQTHKDMMTNMALQESAMIRLQ